MLRIPAEAEKGNQDRLLPITPEFATLLADVPESERRGRVFKLLDIDGTLLQPTRRLVGPIVSAIGKAAGVVVDERIEGRQDCAEVRQCSRPAACVRVSLGVPSYADRATRADAA